jgi:DNA-binding LacI/PurR family transcriptional regulator
MGSIMSDITKKRITINEIARIAGTSKTTVSFYLNGHVDRMSAATRDRVKHTIEETGYKPSPLARGMNAKKTYMLGIIIGDITNHFSNQIVKGIDSIANKAGYHLLISSSNFDRDDERTYIEQLLAVGVDGFIVQPTARFKEVAGLIENMGKHLVFFDSKYYDYTSSWVKTNNYESTYNAIEACITKGYKHVLMVTAKPQMLSSRIERSSGCEDALKAHDIPLSRYIIPDSGLIEDDFHAWLNKNVDGTTPTLVFAPNCWALPKIYATMHDFYPLMPETVGLLGFDNLEWAELASPSISVIAQPAYEEGQQAARILLDLIEGKGSIDPHQVLNCNIKWGTSTL